MVRPFAKKVRNSIPTKCYQSKKRQDRERVSVWERKREEGDCEDVLKGCVKNFDDISVWRENIS